MVHGLVAKVCKCEIEIQAKIGSANTEIHKKIDNTNIHNFVTECGLEQTIPEIECVMTVSIAQLKKCLLWRLWTIVYIVSHLSWFSLVGTSCEDI